MWIRSLSYHLLKQSLLLVYAVIISAVRRRVLHVSVYCTELHAVYRKLYKPKSGHTLTPGPITLPGPLKWSVKFSCKTSAVSSNDRSVIDCRVVYVKGTSDILKIKLAYKSRDHISVTSKSLWAYNDFRFLRHRIHYGKDYMTSFTRLEAEPT